MAQKGYFSTKDILKEVQQREIKNLFDLESSNQINKEIEKKAEEIDAENRKKEAQSRVDLSKIYIVH